VTRATLYQRFSGKVDLVLANRGRVDWTPWSGIAPSRSMTEIPGGELGGRLANAREEFA
jgi:hypothetical protein